MPRTCTICTHPERVEIDKAILAGEPFRKIAERTGTSTPALFRHKCNDIPTVLMKAQEAKEVSYGSDICETQTHDFREIIEGRLQSG